MQGESRTKRFPGNTNKQGPDPLQLTNEPIPPWMVKRGDTSIISKESLIFHYIHLYEPPTEFLLVFHSLSVTIKIGGKYQGGRCDH